MVAFWANLGSNWLKYCILARFYNVFLKCIFGAILDSVKCMTHFFDSPKAIWNVNCKCFSLISYKFQSKNQIVERAILTTRPQRCWWFWVFYYVKIELQTRKSSFPRCMLGNFWCKMHFWTHCIWEHLEALYEKYAILYWFYSYFWKAILRLYLP